MKKFLTVLLALSVVFTYTVGTAFAAVEVKPGETLTHDEVIAKIHTELLTEMKTAVKEAKEDLAETYKEGEIDAKCVIDGAVYADTLAKMEEDFTKAIGLAASIVDKNHATTDYDTLKTAMKTVAVDAGIVYGNKVQTISFNQMAGLIASVTRKPGGADPVQKYYAVYTLVNATDAMKAFLNAEIGKIDMSLYTNDVKDEVFGTTYLQAAEKAKKELLDTVEDTNVNTAMDLNVVKPALQAMYNVLDDLIVVKEITGINGDKTIISYKLVGIETAEDLGYDNAKDEANKETLKAIMLKNAANLYQTGLTEYNNVMKDEGATAANKAEAKEAFELVKKAVDAYKEVNTVLIDEKLAKVEADLVFSGYCVDRVANYEKAADFADVLKLQVEKDGTFKYVASKVDEILADLKVEIYNGKKATVTAADFKDARNVENNFAWEKEVAVAEINADLEELLAEGNGYYAPEKAAVEAEYQKFIDKVNAAENQDQLVEILKGTVDVSKIDNKDTVNGKVERYLNTGKFLDAVNNYVYVLNMNTNEYEDAYREPLTPADKADVAEFLAENGARTNADVAGLFDKAEAYAKAIKTNGEIKAERAAAEALVKALPNYITLADKEAVKAAWEAADAVGYYPTKLINAINMIKAAEKDAIDDMIKALPKTLTAADKAAVDAIYDAIDAFEAEEMYGKNNTYDNKKAVNDAFKAVRNAALADVQKAIAAISANPTKAEVEAARAAVDAFVATYTDATEPYQAIKAIVNLDKLTYAEAVVKANAIKSVEALKVVKNHSVAGKGYIKIAWSTKGDDSAVKGYQIYRATKANGKYTKFFTTSKKTYKNTKSLKKGTKYFYKVRAYAEIDGVKYYSDWSNKAYRVAK